MSRGAPKGNQNAAKDDRKTRQVVVRMTESEYAEMVRKAGRYSPSDYVRMAIKEMSDLS